jgi:hypothetical protein
MHGETVKFLMYVNHLAFCNADEIFMFFVRKEVNFLYFCIN